MNHWKVTRFCCTAGRCEECKKLGTGPEHRHRVTQTDGLTKEKAEQVAKNWRAHGYDGRAEEMKP